MRVACKKTESLSLQLVKDAIEGTVVAIVAQSKVGPEQAIPAVSCAGPILSLLVNEALLEAQATHLLRAMVGACHELALPYPNLRHAYQQQLFEIHKSLRR